MHKRWEKQLDILGPLDQAKRCLDQWLREENRILPEKKKQRAAALMARYFHHEDQVTDQLMFSFLRHYAGRPDIDMEDPTSVRMEIKALLDQSQAEDAVKKNALPAYLIGALIAMLCFSGWELSHKTITREQQVELKALVRQVDDLDPSTTAAGIWAEMKGPLNVRSYQDIPWWRYYGSRKMLEEKITTLKYAVTPTKAGVP